MTDRIESPRAAHDDKPLLPRRADRGCHAIGIELHACQRWNGVWWDVVEFPSNDIVRTFATQRDAELLSEQINRVKPFGDDKLPPFMKGNDRTIDISE